MVPDNVSSTDVARYYGDGAKYKSVWDRMNIINKNAKAISAAVEAGQDPFAVPLDDTQTAAKSNKSQGIHGCCDFCSWNSVFCTLHILFLRFVFSSSVRSPC